MWHTYFSMLKFEKGWLSLALLMNQDNKQFMKTWVFFFRLRALQKRWLERRRRSFEAGIIMKQRGDKLLLKGSFRVLPSSSSVKSLNSARGSKRFLPGCTRCPMHYTTRSVLLSRLDGKYLLARRLKTNLSQKHFWVKERLGAPKYFGGQRNWGQKIYSPKIYFRS